MSENGKNSKYEDLCVPYTGESNTGVDRTTLDKKLMSGYQGWFRTPGDESPHKWNHYSRGEFEPGNVTIEVWPDMTELDEDEKYKTGFTYSNGSPSYVYSSVNKKSVMRHFKWMEDYNHDGVFVQRFFGTAKAHLNGGADAWNSLRPLSLCREGANVYGRTYALMYDLSSMVTADRDLLKEDWMLLRDKMRLTEDDAYLHHNGKPVVSIWGIGFSDRAGYDLDDCMDLVKFFKDEGCTVKIGVPTLWRSLGRGDGGSLKIVTLKVSANQNF